MPSILIISDAQRLTLQSFLNTGSFLEAYRLLRDMAASQSVASGQEANATELARMANWFDTTGHINANDGSFFSELVRGGTIWQGRVAGLAADEDWFQAGSDYLARDVINNVLSGDIQSLSGIIDVDVNSAVVRLGLGDADAWQGTLADFLPPPFGLGGNFVSVDGLTVGEFFGDLLKALASNVYGVLRYAGIGDTLDAAAAWLMDHGMGRLIYYSRKPFDYLDWLKLMPDSVNTDFNSARRWVQRRGPLVIDLDGDGIETTGADGTVLFDHNGDGVKTGTGWVQADDGFLVLDRNGNGLIDTGAELFGVDTVKSDGSRARDGFDALRDLDSNGDLVFDANDAAFGSVRIWQDLDQDGVTDAGELRSLSDAGIVGINLVAPRDNVNLGNGNVQTASAANLFADEQEGITANLDLADNPFVREFTDSIALTEAAQALPDMRGSGMVRDLREAMSLSADLTAAVSTFVGFDSYTSQRAMIDSLVSSWADTSTFHSSVEEAQALGFEVVFLVPGLNGFDYVGSEESLLDPEARAALMAQQAQISHMLEVLEKFNGQRFVTVDQFGVVTASGQELFLQSFLSILSGPPPMEQTASSRTIRRSTYSCRSNKSISLTMATNA